MTKEAKTTKVAATDEAFVYRVESWGSRSLPHRVDCRAFNWNGECGCIDFSTTCIRNIKHQLETTGKLRAVRYGTLDKKNPLRTRCKHIEAAESYVYDFVLPRVFPEEGDPLQHLIAQLT